MRLRRSAAQIICASLISSLPVAHALSPRTEIADNYDFVVVGGGLAGLAIGGRLAEDTNHTVLVLEAGGNGDAYRDRIDTPALAYFDSLWYTPLDWGFYTTPQPHVNDREVYWPRGKVLGGSSAINGLYLTRPGEIEVNAWSSMLSGMDGAENWSWDSLYAAMKKSETFGPPSGAIAQEADITWDAASRGTSGPIRASYPGFTFPQVRDWSTSCDAMGVAITDNLYGGENWGAAVSTSTIDPSSWTRSYSRTGYLDPLPDNGNYDVLANAHVTRIHFDPSSPPDNLRASAVEYTPDEETTEQTVKVNKEVILAAGSVGSPTVLMYSGVGPKDVLSQAGVDLVSELPGVGQHLQDHFSATVTWSTDVQTAGSIFYGGGAARSNPFFLTYIDDAVAYVNSTVMYGSSVGDVEANILSQIRQYAPDTTYDSSVIAGYDAICKTTASQVFNSPIGQVELLFMNSDGNGDIGVTAALQHPYSQGRVYINSSNPMDYPVIDPNYLGNPADIKLLVDGLKLARTVGETSPLADSLTGETSPGPSVQTDEQWLEWLRGVAGSEFHPSSSCAMLPRDKGGVVDANLRVYGLSNVRVADASVPPTALSTHLMASTYGVAEQAANIIRAFWNIKEQRKPVHKFPGSSKPSGSSKFYGSSKSSRPSESPGSSGPSASGSSIPGPFHDTKGSGSPSAPQLHTTPNANENGAASLRQLWVPLFIVGLHVVLVLGFSL